MEVAAPFMDMLLLFLLMSNKDEAGDVGGLVIAVKWEIELDREWVRPLRALLCPPSDDETREVYDDEGDNVDIGVEYTSSSSSSIDCSFLC